jgi:hypothetical protein
MSKTTKLTPLPSDKKNTGTNKKTVIITVIATLLILGAFVATFIAGVKYQKNYEQGISDRVNSEVSKVNLKD